MVKYEAVLLCMLTSVNFVMLTSATTVLNLVTKRVTALLLPVVPNVPTAMILMSVSPISKNA